MNECFTHHKPRFLSTSGISGNSTQNIFHIYQLFVLNIKTRQPFKHTKSPKLKNNQIK